MLPYGIAKFLIIFVAQMKKIVAIFLLIMYSLSVSGSVVQLHFCGNNYKSFSVNAVEEKPCCCPIKKGDNKTGQKEIAKKSCCSKTDLSLKIDIDQSNINGLAQMQFLQMPALLSNEINPIIATFFVSDFSKVVYAAHAPPDGNWQRIPLYKLFQSLVYYA